jgi:hypothetical protein
MSTQEDNKPGSITIPKTHITIYGGKKEDITADIKGILRLHDEDYYSTWVNLGVMRRLGFLFDGGVESAGSIGGLVVMFIVLIAALALFAFWEVTVVFIVIAVLTLLSGGTAFKFLRGTYITRLSSEIDPSELEEFVRIQVSKGHFVRLEGKNATAGMSDIIKDTSSATLIFRLGIQFSLLVATSFLILEVVYFFLERHWLSGLNPATGELERILLVYFAFMFICGVILMDIGVILRHRIAGKNSRKQNTD